jgi:hypothetical protein
VLQIIEKMIHKTFEFLLTLKTQAGRKEDNENLRKRKRQGNKKRREKVTNNEKKREKK